MPWPKDHKAKTRQRIVETAAVAFRERGVDSVGIDEIMAAAGLTRGGFYAHFPSKEALLEAALGFASEETIARLSNAKAGASGAGELLAVVDAYLSEVHAAHPENGCPVAALGAEIARGDGQPRRDLAAGVRRRLAWMTKLLPVGARTSDEDLVAAFACMVGGVILARLAGGRAAVRILAACRSFLHRALADAVD